MKLEIISVIIFPSETNLFSLMVIRCASHDVISARLFCYIGNVSLMFADCAKHDPDVSEDTQKNFAELLSEELKLREAEALEKQQRSDVALLEAKKMTSQYQKEADKCNSGMETCEEAREKAEAALFAQKRLTAVWELRARQRGWKEGVAKSRANVQAI